MSATLPEMTQLPLDPEELHFVGLVIKAWIATTERDVPMALDLSRAAFGWSQRIGPVRLAELDIKFNQLHAAICRKDSTYFPDPERI